MKSRQQTTDDPISANRWRLWVDHCGGFLVLAGNPYRIGSGRTIKWADVNVIADLPRTAGIIERSDDGDYAWQSTTNQDAKIWLTDQQDLPLGDAVIMRVQTPSPLCRSAVLSLMPPYRFGGHVDRVLLVDDVFLVGSDSSCHVRIRAPQTIENTTMMLRDGVWYFRLAEDKTWRSITLGQAFSIGDVTMTMEPGD